MAVFLLAISFIDFELGQGKTKSLVYEICSNSNVDNILMGWTRNNIFQYNPSDIQSHTIPQINTTKAYSESDNVC